MAVIGTAMTRLDGPAKVTGKAHYGSDIAVRQARLCRVGNQYHRKGSHRCHRRSPRPCRDRRDGNFHPPKHRQDLARQDLRWRRLYGLQHRGVAIRRDLL